MRRPFLYSVVALLLFAAGVEQPVRAVSDDAEDPQCELSFIYENDQLFDTDRNYTFGGMVTHSCLQVSLGSLDSAHSWSPLRKWNKPLLEALLGDSKWKHEISSLHFGLSLYTPNDLTEASGKSNGRPYASLLTFEDSILRATETVAIKQGMQLGIMGFPIGGDIQRAVHKILSYDDPRGWPTEISRGGEPVFSYGIQKQWRLCPLSSKCGAGEDDRVFDLTGNVGASVGSYTSLRAGLSGRLGRLRSLFGVDSGPIHSRSLVNPLINLPFRLSLNAEAANASGDDQPRNSTNVARAGYGNRDEWFLFARAGLEHVLYSAVLQGQFRENEYEVASSDVERTVPYASLGGAIRLGKLSRLPIAQLQGSRNQRWEEPQMDQYFHRVFFLMRVDRAPSRSPKQRTIGLLPAASFLIRLAKG